MKSLANNAKIRSWLKFLLIQYCLFICTGGTFDVETLVKAILDLGETKTVEVVQTPSERDLGWWFRLLINVIITII